MTIEQAKYKLLSYAMDQFGYREGPNNWNKYAATPEMTQLLGWNAQNQPWCNIFVNACFVACFGLEIGAAMLYQPIGGGSALCRASADFFKAAGAWIERGRTPEPGDVIFFYRSGDINHTGIVVGVATGSVTTIEGNSSDMVAKRIYSLSDSKIAGYGRPNWTVVADGDGKKEDPMSDLPIQVEENRHYELRLPYLRSGSVGTSVIAVQFQLVAQGYYIGPDGADGEFGPSTEAAVKEYQRNIGLSADGIVGPDTGAKLFGAEVFTAPKVEAKSDEKSEDVRPDTFWNNLLNKIKK